MTLRSSTNSINKVLVTLFAVMVLGNSAAPLKKITDKRINESIASDLLIDKSISAHMIDVSTKDGIVTLEGFIDNMLAMNRAVALAKSIKGVRGVINKIIVNPIERSDAEIKNDVVMALLLDGATDLHEINTDVKNSIVIL